MLETETSVGSDIRVLYVLKTPACRAAFLELMSELQVTTVDLMTQVGAGADGYTIVELPGRPGWFLETLRFASEKERTRFDELFCADRRGAAAHALLDDLLDSARSDYVVTRGRRLA
jgi:hypothetical protein